LQYFSGTLNLPIETILLNFISQQYGDGDIDWEEVIKVPEFVGHTMFTIRKLYQKLKNGACRKYKININDIKVQDLLRYTQDKRKRNLSKSKEARNKHIIDYFAKRIEQLRINDFIL